jgi:glycerol transport system permease protein
MKQRPWLFLLPTLLLMSVSAFLPLMTVINYSLHNIFAGSKAQFVGLQNYVQVMHDVNFQQALLRQMFFSLTILLIEIPLGILIALLLPRKGPGVALSLILLGIPLLIPYNVVGIVWRLFSQSDIGIIPNITSIFGYQYNVSLQSVDAFVTLLLVDIWHWTPLAVLLSYAGLLSIPDAYYKAAQVDGASGWQTFCYVTLPKLRPVLTLAILLRFMDSFKIYSEPLLLTGGGPGNATTFLSLFVARKAESYELGYAGAASIVYLYIVIVLSYLFYQFATRVQKEQTV